MIGIEEGNDDVGGQGRVVDIELVTATLLQRLPIEARVLARHRQSCFAALRGG